MDRDTRNLLANTTQALRRGLEEEFALQLEGRFDVLRDGAIADAPGPQLDDREKFTRHKIVETIQHRRASGESDPESVDGFLRETAFTFLNRLAALKMMEARGIVQECVSACDSHGFNARGFKEFGGLAPGLIDIPDGGYRLYLECIFDEIGREVGILFDRTDPASLLWPRRTALLDALGRINDPKLAGIWSEDETIGWIYQYYNDPEERRKMRDVKQGGSAAPRNSREMAVRNQFFTPRYVVEFLTDNALGRLWYEMTKGKTFLKDRCRYLIKRPVELFLPDPNEYIWHEAPGLDAFRRYSATASPHDLPEDPALGTLLGWIELIMPALLTDELEGIPRPDHKILTSILSPLESGTHPAAPDSATTLELLQVLWRISFDFRDNGYGRPMAPVSEDAAAGPLWKTLREKLLHPPENLTKEEQLQQPVFIPHRPIKDPRQIRMIDPACGSMHFGLYAFDLLEIIYQEAWEIQLAGVSRGQQAVGSENHGKQHIAQLSGLDRMAEGHGSGRSHLHDQPLVSEGGTLRTDQPDSQGSGIHTLEHRGGSGPTDEGRVPASSVGGSRLDPGSGNPDHDRPAAGILSPGGRGGSPQLGGGGRSSHPGTHELPGPLTSSTAYSPLHTAYATKEEFLHRIPALILEHNIHGIDIDPRAAQIAGLALWLRAQKAWQQQGLRPAERPTVTRSNIVCAEPMPGEEDLLLRFVERSFPSSERPFFTRLLGEIFKTMRLAGEAGSLLKIEDDVSALVADARAQWKKIGKRDGDFFSQAELVNLDRRTILQQPIDTGTWSLDALSGIPDSQFWEKAEERIYDALRAFAESAEGNYQRRLFADDAAHGFAFIDLCRQRYDVALMNPPFGDASLPSKPYLDETYGDTKGDVYKAFVECFQARLVPAGFLGIISSRTGFFLGQSEDWRTRVVLRLFRPIALADLGMGVLDAMVEVAAYVLRSLSESETRELTHSIVPTLETVVRDKLDRFSLPKWQTARNGLKRHQAVAELEHLEAEGFIQRCDGDVVRYSPQWNNVKSVTITSTPVYPQFICVRVLAETDKEISIRTAIQYPTSKTVYISDPAAFSEIPSSPFAYWTSARMRDLFKNLPRAESESRRFTKGLCTTDDGRFLRAFWEIEPTNYGTSNEELASRKSWASFAKGGSAKRFYCDTPLVINWAATGAELKAFLDWKIGKDGQWSRWINSVDYYFQPGLTWPLRASHFSPQALPQGCIFSVRGYAAFAPTNDLPWLLGLLGSSAFDFLFKTLLGRFGFPEFVVGALQNLPIPEVRIDDADMLGSGAKKAWAEKRSVDCAESTSHSFVLPALLNDEGENLSARVAAWTGNLTLKEETVSCIQSEIDDLTFKLYGLEDSDRDALSNTLATEPIAHEEASEDHEDEDDDPVSCDAPDLTANLLEYTLGAAFGRWDLRFATGEKPAPPEPDPFDPLPVCPPGMLQNADGLPATQSDVPANYPLRVSWPGILVDDKGHDEDIETRVREVLAVVFPDRVDEIAHEACEILGVKTLREFFRKPAAFFAGHLKRHSKSRRQAPIYLPLSSPNGRYTLWLYYPRLTADTLFTALRDFLEPKLQYEEGRAFRIRQDAGPTPAPSQRAEIAEADELVDDLRALRDELKRVAPLFKPDLNDGVILNHAPLWRMIGLPKWRKDCQATWEKLAAGDYDWAHLALHLWPERVIPKCATDRSLAIAHDLESTFWEEIPVDELPKSRGRATKKPAKKKAKVGAPDGADDAYSLGDGDDDLGDDGGGGGGGDDATNDSTITGTGKWRPKQVSSEQLQQLIATRTSPAVKAALEALAAAPTSGGAKKKAKKGGNT
jgi:hypothetical protein